MNNIAPPWGQGSAGNHPGRSEAVPVVAVVLALLVGPLGAGLAVWWLRTRPGEQRRRSMARAAVALGVLQTLLVVLLVFVLPGWRESSPEPAPGSSSASSSPQTGSALPSETRSYPTTPPPSAPTGLPATPAPPTATSLEEFVPAQVYQYQWQAEGEDAGAVEAGAIEALSGAFETDDQTIPAQMAQWSTPAEAEAFALAAAKRDFGDSAPLGEGSIQSGAGYFWYYERGGVGTIYWHLGSFSAEFSGEPLDVQEFFVSFPK